MIPRNRFDSDEEWYFSWYLDDLKEAGFISDYQYPGKTFALSEKVRKKYDEVLKTKIKRVDRELLRSHTYTCDFLIWWESRAYKTLFTTLKIVDSRYKYIPFTANIEVPRHYEVNPSPVRMSYIDVKPEVARRFTGKLASFHTFPIDQKWVMKKYNIYVQKIAVPKVFKQTFTPSRYLRTDGDRQDRVMDYEPKELHRYLIEQKNKKDAIQGEGDQTKIF
ncbi:hypothetical protein LCGC14_0246210 [marine sediment metagenome]|uniref:Uncharacterized protein n=1 Tax=marine sediment metagenome TaxID=412755 RepID=A0A0F9U680_9ZZZZ